MTKLELSKKIADKSGLHYKEAQNLLNIMTESIKEEMLAGNEVFLRRFGTFQLKQRKAKMARDIGRGKTIPIPAAIIPSFKCCKEFKAEVNRKGEAV